MSMFLPEQTQTQQTVDLSSSAPASDTSQADIALMQRVFSAAMKSPSLIPEGFMSYMLDWIQTQRLSIPIGQVFGFSRFTAQQANATSFDSGVTTTTFAAFSDGPVLSGLGPGNYVVIIACDIRSNSGAAARMGYSVNGGDPDAIKSCTVQESVGFISAAQVAIERLSDPANTLTAQRRIDVAAGNADFGFRSITALKYANL